LIRIPEILFQLFLGRNINDVPLGNAHLFLGVVMQTEKLKISGMTCGGCVNKVTNALKAISGVDTVVVSLADGEATILFDASITSSAALISAVKAAGYGSNETTSISSPQSKRGCCG
jgi:copper chaperone